jgi:hypothetical protein
MPNFAPVDQIVGTQQIAFYGLPDNVARMQSGMLLAAVDNWWGAGEFIYCRANGTINMGALVVLTPVFDINTYRYNATEVPNTANLGRTVGVACTSAAAGQFFWVQVGGLCPVRSTASVAADTTFGITGAGQIGANSAGKQILNARIMAPATTTVVKANCTANAASNQLLVPNSDGWFIGAFLSGTGIAVATVVTDINPSGRVVTLSANTTAAVNGSVTATYNNGTVFFNVAHLNRPFAQGAIT